MTETTSPTRTLQTTNAASTRPLGVAIAEALARELDRPVTDGTPLQDVVDVDSVATLLDADVEGPLPVTVSFGYEGHRVTVTSDGTIDVTSDAV